MIPMVFESLKEVQFGGSIVSGVLLGAIGVFIILIWQDKVGIHSLALEHVKLGYTLIGCGVLIFIFGLYLLIPFIILFTIIVLFLVIRAGKRVFFQ